MIRVGLGAYLSQLANPLIFLLFIKKILKLSAFGSTMLALIKFGSGSGRSEYPSKIPVPSRSDQFKSYQTRGGSGPETEQFARCG